MPNSTKNEFVRSFFGRIRGYQKVLSNLSDLYLLTKMEIMSQLHVYFNSTLIRELRVHKKIFVPCIYLFFFFSFSDSSDKTKGRAYLLKKKVLPRWDSNRGNTLHTVSFDWLGLEWILNLEFCLLKLLIFYQKLLWNIRSRLNSTIFWVFESVFNYVWSKLKLCEQKMKIPD